MPSSESLYGVLARRKTKNTVAEILITHLNNFVTMECGYSDVSITIISVHDAQGKILPDKEKHC